MGVGLDIVKTILTITAAVLSTMANQWTQRNGKTVANVLRPQSQPVVWRWYVWWQQLQSGVYLKL